MAVLVTITITVEDGGLPIAIKGASAMVDPIMNFVREFGAAEITAVRAQAIELDYPSAATITVKIT